LFLFDLIVQIRYGMTLSTEAVEGAALALEGVDDVKSSDGLAASVLSVGDGVADDVLKENLQDTSSQRLNINAGSGHMNKNSTCYSSILRRK
jgi:hypothetical protein